MANWVVTGANRGIGLEMCRQLKARGDTVYAACRSSSKELDGLGCKVISGVDVTTDAAATAIERALEGAKIDVLLNNAGVLLRDSLDASDMIANMQKQFEINTVGPMRLTKALLPQMAGKGSKIGFVSSRAGSIGDHPSGGIYGYRISKTALNMAGANLARDLSDRGIFVALLHPGFIRTDMTSGAGNEDPPVAVKGLIERMDELTADKSGHFVHANGQALPW